MGQENAVAGDAEVHRHPRDEQGVGEAPEGQDLDEEGPQHGDVPQQRGEGGLPHDGRGDAPGAGELGEESEEERGEQQAQAEVAAEELGLRGALLARNSRSISGHASEHRPPNSRQMAAVALKYREHPAR